MLDESSIPGMGDADPIHQQVLDALTDRKVREVRQATWYQMRHDGVPRGKKPWPNAADLHFPLADSQIDKQKPYYVQQIFGAELLASFFSVDKDNVKYQAAAAEWFDDKVRHSSDFLRQSNFWVDAGLQDGRSYLKIFWDVEKNRLGIEAIKDHYIIVPGWTRTLQDADWLVHVEQYSVSKFKRSPEFAAIAKDDDLLKRLQETDNSLAAQDKYTREGITKPTSGQIVVWRRYEREGGQWFIKTYSPMAPEVDLCPRKGVPYKHGKLPFVPFDVEWKDDGAFSSRGLCERLAPYEAWLNKLWNEKSDSITLFNRPLLTSESRIATGNIRWRPGEVLPGVKIERVDLGSPPISLDQEMLNTRSVAEDLVQTPDFGIVKGPGQEARTATEIDKITQLSSQSQTGRGFMLGQQVGEAYLQMWSLLQQYSSGDLSYYFRTELLDLDPSALKGNYRILPTGATDSWNKAARFQKAAYRYSTLGNDPNIVHEELVKSFLEADEPALIKRLYRSTDMMTGDQMEHQAQEILLLMASFPAQVQPTDDDAVHIAIVAQFIQRRAVSKEGVTPEQARLFVAHLQQHAQQLQKKNPDTLRSLMGQYGTVFQALNQRAAADQPAPGQGAPGQPGPQQQSQPQPIGQP